MSILIILSLFTGYFQLVFPPAEAQQSPPLSGAPQQASSLLNPNISVVGEFLGSAGNDPSLDNRAFVFREAEIAFQAPVDPYSRADAFVAVGAEGIDLEEAYLTLLTLPAGLQARIGKFRSSFGAFNRIHPPETPFADRPLAAEVFLGEEGVVGTGMAVSYLIPNPFGVYLNLDSEIVAAWEESPSFGESDSTTGEIIKEGKKKDLGYLGRLSTYTDLSESSNLTTGASYATGIHNSEGDLRTHLINLDLTFRWKPLQRAIYKSFLWRTEFLLNRRSIADAPAIKSFGLFSYIHYQFLRRWRLGLRYDETESPESSSKRERGGLASLTFSPSEFSMMSLQGRLIHRANGDLDRAGFLKILFNIGPHGAHPF